jgi:hypothetical protein
VRGFGSGSVVRVLGSVVHAILQRGPAQLARSIGEGVVGKLNIVMTILGIESGEIVRGFCESALAWSNPRTQIRVVLGAV